MAKLRKRARIALDEIRADAKKRGLDKMTMPEINALIAEVRREKRIAK